MLHDNLIALRKAKGMTQNEMANHLCVVRQTISKWEKGLSIPDAEMLLRIAELFEVPASTLLDESTQTDVRNFSAENNAYSNANRAAKAYSKKIILCGSALLCLAIAIICVLTLVVRSQILHPQGLDNNIVITRKESLRIDEGNTATIVFSERNKPAIACQLPEGFAADAERSGFYTDKSGNFIKFHADYAENVMNPLLGTDYYSYYEDRGYQSYLDMARLAMYLDLSKVSVFSSKEQLHLAGGAQLIREQFCAGQNADYYEIGGGLTTSGDEMRIYGFALHFEDTTWLITLEDCNDIYYFITIKDPDGIGKSIDTVGELLSSISVAE